MRPFSSARIHSSVGWSFPAGGSSKEEMNRATFQSFVRNFPAPPIFASEIR